MNEWMNFEFFTYFKFVFIYSTIFRGTMVWNPQGKHHKEQWYFIWVKFFLALKVKCTHVQALRLCTGRTVHRGSRGIALPLLDHGLKGGEGSASRPARFLPPVKTRYPLYRRLGGSQGRSGQVRKISHPLGFDPRTVQPVASRYTDWATRPTSVLHWSGLTL